MFGIPVEHVTTIANFIGLGILGLLAYFGQRWGKAQPTPAEKQVTLAGALVDSTSVRELTAVLEAHRKENEDGRHQMRRAVDALQKLVAAIEKLADETEEMRRDNQIGRIKPP
jgi:hypothetical protein